MYLLPGHPIIAIRNNRNQNGRRICKKVCDLLVSLTEGTSGGVCIDFWSTISNAVSQTSVDLNMAARKPGP